MALTLKVFYEKSNGNKEIRRFPLKASEDGDFFKMALDKIKQLYPDLKNGDFQLFWQDSDGDRIVFSCMEEMQEALNQVQDGVLRIYVTGPTNKSSPEKESIPKPQNTSKAKQQSSEPKQKEKDAKPERPFHQGVVCDGCDGPVFGIRYKCCVCPDYDLCEECEGKGMHQDHDMYKIPTPMRPMGGQPPNMGRFFNRFMHRFNNKFGRGASAGAANSAGGSSTGAQSTAPELEKCGKKNKEQFNEYLNNVGANIAAFLDPFGIDVTYDVHDSTGKCNMKEGGNWRRGGGRCSGWRKRRQEAKSQAAQSEQQAGETKTEKASETSDAGKSAGQENVNDKPQSSSDKATATSEANKPSSTVKEDGEQKSSNSSTNSTESPMDVEVETIVKQTQEMSTLPATSPNEEWTFVEEPEPEFEDLLLDPTLNCFEDTPTPAPIPSPSPSAPELTPASAFASAPVSAPGSCSTGQTTGLYPDLRIQQSLDQMLSMGFTNTDGWLGRLLAEHNGDIGLVLDAIKAKATQQLENLRGTQ